MPSREPNQTAEPLRPQQDRLYTGKLLEHGRANHEFHPRGLASYYVKLLSDSGTQILWSKGLERAFTDSKTKPGLGDLIGIRENNLDPLSIVTRKQVNGVVVATRQYDTPRPHWIVEKLEEFDRRKFAAQALRDPTIPRREAVMSHRELLGFYWVLDAAKKVAEAKIKDPERQALFLKLTRESLALAVERAEPAPAPLQQPESTTRTERSARPASHDDPARALE